MIHLWLRGTFFHRFGQSAYRFFVEADHFADANRYLPWRYAIGTLALVAVAAGLCGWLMHGNAFVLLAGILGVLGLGLVWPWISMWGLSGSVRFLDSRVSEGESTVVEFEFLSRLPIGLWGIRIQGDVGRRPVDQRGDTFVHSLAFVPGWRRSRFRWVYQADQRGEFPAGELRISTAFPFGLWEVSKPLDVAGDLLVRPRTFAVRDIPDAAANDRSVDGAVLKNRVGQSGDLLGLRPYRPGDPMKRIHWRQSARNDRLIVCEQQATAAPRIQIVLDLDPEIHCGMGNDSTREWAIRIAASLCCGMHQSGVAVSLVVSDQVSEAGVIRSESQVLDRLARVRSEDGEALNQLLHRVECVDFREGLQLVITTTPGLNLIDSEWGRRAATHFLAIHASDRQASTSSRLHDSNLDSPVSAWIQLSASQEVPLEFAERWQAILCSN